MGRRCETHDQEGAQEAHIGHFHGSIPDSIDAALSLVEKWPASNAVAAAVVGGTVSTHGDATRPFGWASLTKLLTALAVLLAVEEGTLTLEDPAGPEGSTVRHLLAHASGLAPGGISGETGHPGAGYRGRIDHFRQIAKPGNRRIYSNAGFELLATLVAERSGMDFQSYLYEGVLEPLGLNGVSLEGSPAYGAVGTLTDLGLLGKELLDPQLLAVETMAEATSVAFAGLGGVLPGYGRMEPNDWGLGFEIRGGKCPHWTGNSNSARTFGHFGQSGSLLWVDPEARVACASLADRPFGDWAVEEWPILSDAVLVAAAATS